MLRHKWFQNNWAKVLIAAVVVLGFCGIALADTGGAQTIGDVSKKITGSFMDLGKLMVAIAYLAGFGFTIAAIFKFKQHKDNPTQIPIGTPIALLVIGIVLIFLPGIIKIGGGTASLTEAGGFTGEGVKAVPGVTTSAGT